MNGLETLLICLCWLVGICLLPAAFVALGTVAVYGVGLVLVAGEAIAECWVKFMTWIKR